MGTSNARDAGVRTVELLGGQLFHLSSVGWSGAALLGAVFAIGTWVGSRVSKCEDLADLLRKIEDQRTIDKLNAVSEKLHELVKGENAKTLDQLSRLLGRLIVLDRTGTAVALMLAGLGASVGIVASSAAPWIDGTGSFNTTELWHGGIVAAVVFAVIAVGYCVFRFAYRRMHVDARKITGADDKTVQAAVSLIQYAVKSGSADRATLAP